MLGAGEALCAGQSDVDGFGGQCCIAGAGAQGLVHQVLYHFFQGVEAEAKQLLGLRRSSFEPAAGDLAEQALLAAKPLQPKGLDVRLATQRSGSLTRLSLQHSESLDRKST